MDFLIKPWRHQVEAIHRASTMRNFALFFEQGTGKTLTCVNMLRTKYIQQGRMLKTIIFCPGIVIDNWKREILANSHIGEELIVPLTGSQIIRKEKFSSHTWGGHKIFITNYESLNMTDLFNRFLLYAPEVLVFDESHLVKGLIAKRTKNAIKLSDKVRHRFLLTGTPILNSLLDVFSQYRILDGGQTFGKNFYEFKYKYFVDMNAAWKSKKNYFPDWQPKPMAAANISNKMYQKAVVVKKEDCLDLPDLVRVPVYYEMDYKLRRAYEQMKELFITYVEGEAVTADLAIVKFLRLQQMASGFVQFENGKTQHFPARAEALKELLRLNVESHKVIVWAVFKENYKVIRKVCDELKVKYVEVHGEVSYADKIKAVDEFNNNADVRVFFGHPASGGVGINLTASDTSIFYSRSWSLGNDLQAEARNHRGGSEIHSKITRYDLICKDTIDDDVLTALRNKTKLSLTVLKGIAKEMKNER